MRLLPTVLMRRDPSLSSKLEGGRATDPEAGLGGGVHGGMAALRLLQQLDSLRAIETAGGRQSSAVVVFERQCTVLCMPLESPLSLEECCMNGCCQCSVLDIRAAPRPRPLSATCRAADMEQLVRDCSCHGEAACQQHLRQQQEAGDDRGTEEGSQDPAEESPAAAGGSQPSSPRGAAPQAAAGGWAASAPSAAVIALEASCRGVR